MPVKDAGCLIEPPVSVPIVAGVRLAAKALADPPEDPPGTKFLPTGFIVFPKKLVSLDEPIANSSQLSFPSKIAPSDHKLSVTVDSYVGIKFDKILLPAVVFVFFVQNKSLTANGIPESKPLKSFFASKSLALFILFSKQVVIKQFKFLLFSMFLIK